MADDEDAGRAAAGTVADEAARLLEALGGWATHASPTRAWRRATAGTTSRARPTAPAPPAAGARHAYDDPGTPYDDPGPPDAARTRTVPAASPAARRTVWAGRSPARCARSARASACCARCDPRRWTGWPTSPAPWPRPCATSPRQRRADGDRRRRPGGAAGVRRKPPAHRPPRTGSVQDIPVDDERQHPTKETPRHECDDRRGHRRHQDRRRRRRQRRARSSPAPAVRPPPRTPTRSPTTSADLVARARCRPHGRRAASGVACAGFIDKHRRDACCSPPTSPGATSRSRCGSRRSSTSP